MHNELNKVKYGTCPVCHGLRRVPANDYRYKTSSAGYDPSTDTLPCTNCGGQTMSGKPQGFVNLRPDGTPCVHEYSGAKHGNCYHVYTCLHCGHRYDIDSSD